MKTSDMTRRWLALRLLSIARPVIVPLVLSLLARVGALICGVAIFTVAGAQIGAIGEQNPAAWGLAATAGVIVALSLAKALLRYFEQFAGHWVAFRSLALLRMHFYRELEPQAPALTEALESGDVLQRVTKDVDRVEVFFAHTIAPLASAFIVPPLIIAWLGCAVSWPVAGVLAVFLILAGIVVPVLGSRASDRSATAARRVRGVLSHHVTDSVQGVREVLAFGAQERRHAELKDFEAEVGAAQRTMGWWNGVRRGANQALLGGAVVAVAWASSNAYLAGSLSLSQVGAAIATALASFAPIIAVEDFIADLDQAWASARRIFEIAEREALVADPANPRPLPPFDGGAGLDVEGVDFAYPNLSLAHASGDEDGRRTDARPRVLHRVSVSIRPGSTTAIVGASGSGKSTLAALLARIWDPQAGAIRINRVDLRDLAVTDLRDVVAYAPQNAHVFNDSIRANLLMAAPDADEAALERVLAAVDLSEWVASEPEGMDTVVAEMGERLSGGQRQRLAIARTLLRGAEVTILDEATSQVDEATERRVLEGIANYLQGRTLVFVAHRLSTVRRAEQIIVMDAGRVVEVGTWDDLMARGGAFCALMAREGRE